MNKLLSIIVGAALFTATSVAHACFAGGSITSCAAAPGVTQVDFTKVSVAPNQTTLTTTAGGVGVTVTSTGGAISSSNEGLGVVGNGTNDLNSGESLTVKFAAPVDIQQIVLNDVDNSRTIDVRKGSISVYDQTGALVKTTAVYDNVWSDDAMTLNLNKVGDIIASAKITGGTEAFNLGSICFKEVPPGGTGVPELSKAGAMSTGLLLAGIALAFSGRRRRPEDGARRQA